ncbi:MULTISPECIES: hypothetical protein [unclassified Bradyrhizobium]|uniref:hypothetical protein n=1 Tax=unclassified Bradyrhizobium TaxID=2631580 RepID=UPI001BAAF049|nr:MULTISPECIES: hypothetical protein [unclassified Bradyrhizobium]MBR1228504.1 hypothetical protein [Bradyrhizobium sp. AUGA SZCCT0176]MBR1297242.1 hypothetical protein [Bradyrhizobium sp. AUGA SZCCT0042]
MGTKAALTAGTTAVALLLLLAGCSATPESLESKSDNVSQNYADNYEEVYRRLTSTARRCVTGGTNAARNEVVSNLHQELGFAVVRFVVIGVFADNYFLSAKIEKMGSGSRVSVKTNNPIISDRLNKKVFRWAGGDQECNP